MLFEMISGRPPYVGVSLGKVIQQHLQAPIPSLREHRPEAPEALDRILTKALAKDRAGRYQTADEMVEALRLVAAATTLERSMPIGERTATNIPTAAAGASASAAPASNDRRLLYGVAMLAVVAVGALIYVLLTK